MHTLADRALGRLLAALVLTGSSALSLVDEPLDTVSLLQRRAIGQKSSPRAALPQLAARTGIYTVEINLDLPPRERWKAAYANPYRRQQAIEFALMADTSVTDLFLARADFSEDEEFLEEIRGIVEVINHPAVTFKTALYNELGYERGATMGCSSLIASRPDGTVVQGRNLDLPPPYPEVSDIVFTRGGKPLFVSGSFNGGMVGVHTGFRFGKFSVAQNTRSEGNSLEANLEGASRGGRAFMFLFRRVLQDVDSFSEAVHALSSTPVMAPQYFTMAGSGPFEGALTTRGRQGSPTMWTNTVLLNPSIGRWFLAQTNDDTFQKTRQDDRLDSLTAWVGGLSSANVSLDAIQDIMVTAPVHAPGTVFTWVLEPSANVRRVLPFAPR